MAVIVVFVLFIVYRLFNLQVINHNLYVAKAANQYGQQTIIPANRGEIYLDGSPKNPPVLVATNVIQNLVYLQPKAMSDADKQTAADKLSDIVQISSKDILEKIDSGNPNYLPLKHGLSDDESAKIKDLDLKGVNLQPETLRYYPQNNLASQVLGFLGFKGDQRVGQYGVEGAFNSQLAGEPGIKSALKGLSGSLLSFDSGDSAPKDGDDIYLTIDPAIQYEVQNVLQNAVTGHKADSGSAIVVNPKTGAVLAMANYPDFDPNQYSKAPSSSVYSNGAAMSDYEPGSVFKSITLAMGINEGKVTPQSTYNDTGELDFDQFKIKNSDHKAHGIQTMTQVLDESLNTGAAYVASLVGHDKFKEYVEKFGFGKSVDFDLPDSKGNIDNLSRSGDVYFATASFGQGITVTGLQLIQAYTAIANGGQMMKPYLVDKVIHSDGSVDQKKPTPEAKVLDSKTAATLSAMLVDVVENGHGKRAGVKGYYIGGKTGTAQVANVGKPGYDPTRNIGSFIGFGPIENPAFLMLVRVDNPRDVTFAESSAAPAFGQIASFILNYMQIPPTRQ